LSYTSEPPYFAQPCLKYGKKFAGRKFLLSRLLLLFINVPALELILLIQIGQWVGTLPTFGLIIFTGILGAFLARRQGVQVLGRMRSEMQKGQLPTEAIFDGAIILVAGALLMTPGILTDTVGFLCLIPATRRVIKGLIRARLERAIRSGQILTTTYRPGGRNQSPPDDVVIIDHDDYTSE
jgi:UPF0716 protein FxsA